MEEKISNWPKEKFCAAKTHATPRLPAPRSIIIWPTPYKESLVYLDHCWDEDWKKNQSAITSAIVFMARFCAPTNHRQVSMR